jgi:hypothetical protein
MTSAGRTSFALLEGATACVLALVPAALVWLAAAEYLPTWCRLASVEWEICGVLLLVSAAVLLVSVLALLQTWGTDSSRVAQGPVSAERRQAGS